MVIGEVSAPVEEKLEAEEEEQGGDMMASNMSLDYQPDLQVGTLFLKLDICNVIKYLLLSFVARSRDYSSQLNVNFVFYLF